MKNKGFTLIELLAVIVILGILALITTPLVLNTIESTRIGAAKAGVTNYVSLLEDELVKSQVLHPEEKIGSGKYDILEDGRYKAGEEVKTLQVKGELPKEGTICVDDDGIVNKYSVVIGNYVVSNITGEQEAKEGDTALKITCDITKETVKISVKSNANVCEKEKVVEIEYPDIDRVEKQYSFDKETWYTYEGEIVVKENKTIYARVYDGETAGVTSSIIISKADNEKVSNTIPSVKLSSTKPTSVIEANIRQTDNCEIDTNTIEYGIGESEDGTYKYGKNKVFEGLKNNTTYYIKTRANDIAGNGVVESVPSKITTGNFGVITLEPDIVNWSSSKNITIIGSTTGAKLEYLIRKYNFTTNSYEVSNWESYKDAVTLNSMATSEYPTTVYARFNDGINTSREATLSITKIDTTSPVLTVGSINTTTKSITVPFTAIDTESGIRSTECLYGTSESYGLKGKVENNRCVIDGIKTGVTYYYKIITTNNAGLKAEAKGNTKTSGFNKITLTPNTNSWTTSKEITITGATTGAVLEYRVRKYNFSTNSYEVSNWESYKSAVTLNSMATSEYPATVYARFNDGVNTSSEATLSITTIDTTSPVLTIGSITKTTKSITIPFTTVDNESGVKIPTCIYGENTNYGSSGIIKENSKCIIENIKSGTTYYYKIVATNNAGISTTQVGNSATGTFNKITISSSSNNWSTSKTVTIAGSTEGATLEYRVRKYNFTTNSYEVSNWESYNSAVTLNSMATSEYPTTVYARFNDGYNTSNETTFNITTIDTTAPSLTVGNINSTTKSITVPYTAADSESGIKSTTCEYGTSTSYGTKGTVSNNSCVMNNVKNGTKYYYKIVTTNNSGISVTKIGDSETGSFNGIVLSPSPSGWSTSKTVTITGSTIGAKLEYRVRKYNFSTNSYEIGNWESYNNAITLNNAATNEYPTTVYARFNDGYNTSNEATLSITTIDITAPTEASFTYTKSTNSIKVVVSGTDAESGISKYWFSKDGGKSWTAAQASNTYTFTGLSSGTYPIMVSVGNGTYGNSSTTGYKNSSITNVTLDSLGTCSVGSASPSGWSTSKSVGITKSGNGTLQYRVGSGSWTNYASAITINWNATALSPVSVSCRVTDGVNVSSGNTVSVASVDTTTPTETSFTTSTATNNIKVVASATDTESGIYGYQFSKDNGTNWTSIQTSNIYTFTGLTSGTYQIKVRAYNGTYGNGGRLYKDSEAKIVQTSALGTCSVGSASPSGWSTSKSVGITKSGNGTLQYKMEGGNWTNYTSAITLTSNTSVYCRVTDGTNTNAGNTMKITTIDTTAPLCSLEVLNYSLNPSITIKANCTDNESGIKNYSYSSDNGSNYTTLTNNEYTFNTFEISKINIIVTDNVGHKTSINISDDIKNNIYYQWMNLLNNDINNVINNSFLTKYPIGSIYITTNTSENTTSKMASLHGGTWEVYASGRTIVGAGDGYNINTTGGSSTSSITISTNNLPSHSHTLTPAGSVSSAFSGNTVYTSSNGSHRHYSRMYQASDEANGFGLLYETQNGFCDRVIVNGGSMSTSSSGNHNHYVTFQGSVSSSFNGNTSSTSSVGLGQAINVDVQTPYVTVYMYKRIS